MRCFLELVAFFALFTGLRAQQECRAGAADLAFVIDGSQYVKDGDFKLALDDAAAITNLVHVGPKEEDSRVAMVTFDGKSNVEFRLDDTSNVDVVNRINGVKKPSAGGVDIAAGMDAATRQVFNRVEPKTRKAPKFMIIVTASTDHSDVRAEHSLANEIGVIPIAVGVTYGQKTKQKILSKSETSASGASKDQLAIATGNPGYVYMISEYSELKVALNRIMCEIIGQISTPTPPPPTPSTTTPPTKPPVAPGSGNSARGCDCDYRKTWLDLVFVFDSSQAVSRYDFYGVRNFVAAFVSQIPVSQQQGAFSRVGIINVAENAEVVADLHDFTDARSAFQKLRKLQYIGKADVNMRKGLIAAKDMVQRANDRPNVKKVVVLFTSKDELCSYQLLKKTKAVSDTFKDDENPCRIASWFVENNHILLTVGLKYDGSKQYPTLNMGSHCFKLNYDMSFTQNFLDAMCRANCYCLPPYVQYEHVDTCVEYGECVYVEGEPVSRSVAQVTCNDLKANLVDVFSADKESFINEVQAPYGYSNTWLALQSVNGQYEWDGVKMTPNDYTHWATGEPNLSNGKCVLYDREKGWLSKECDDFVTTAYFLCQKRSCDALHYCTFADFKARAGK